MACLVSSSEIEKPASCCSDGLGLNYTIPMFHECKKELHPNGSMVQKIPKIIPYTAKEAACPRRKSKLGIPPGRRVCKFPYCIEDRCKNGWCEETMKGYKCHCSHGYRGSDCSSHSTSSLADRPVPPADSTPHCPKITTFTELTSTQDDTTTTTDSTLSTTASNSESTSTQDDTTTTTTTTLSTTAADSGKTAFLSHSLSCALLPFSLMK
ncbi:uncharacterized protein LOC121423553 [Lytechinus variegatus]|uniref:uncharacterized protein LOC121423553 n=1 Tax=Lytechinus variegatus TaxID=7654 RepID=UPI001BB2A54B|nr:uncharacterized protein LOC121423553 [Lytechinus variegatus]